MSSSTASICLLDCSSWVIASSELSVSKPWAARDARQRHGVEVVPSGFATRGVRISAHALNSSEGGDGLREKIRSVGYCG
jgi:hypothetical protein